MDEEKLADLLEKLINLYLSYTEKYGFFGGLIDFFDLTSEKNLDKKIDVFEKCIKEGIPLEKLELSETELKEVLEKYPTTKIWDKPPFTND